MPQENGELKSEMLPGADASWFEIEKFALTYDGYTEAGSLEKCAAIANAKRNDTLDELRTCLFFEQRRWRHFGEVPEGEDLLYIRSIVDQIRSRLERGTQS